MLRMVATRFDSRASFGRNSSTCSPGTDVGIDKCGPPVGIPGFGSQVSNWLGPPLIQSRITCFCRCAARSAFSAANRFPNPPNAIPPAMAPRSSTRRETTCSRRCCSSIKWSSIKRLADWGLVMVGRVSRPVRVFLRNHRPITQKGLDLWTGLETRPTTRPTRCYETHFQPSRSHSGLIHNRHAAGGRPAFSGLRPRYWIEFHRCSPSRRMRS